ncbi:MAG: hypothetical protein KIS83_03640 [Rubrivivax sp.]|nr:hypothetical protein [Rubrivivax sp.]
MTQLNVSFALRALVAAALTALSLPSLAVGAICPADSTQRDVTPQFQGGVLRCLARGLATPACPPTHAIYRIMPEQSGQPAQDFCAPPNIIVPAPSQRASVNCPPGMNVVIQGASGQGDKRDVCRSANTMQIPPTIIPN